LRWLLVIPRLCPVMEASKEMPVKKFQSHCWYRIVDILKENKFQIEAHVNSAGIWESVRWVEMWKRSGEYTETKHIRYDSIQNDLDPALQAIFLSWQNKIETSQHDFETWDCECVQISWSNRIEVEGKRLDIQQRTPFNEALGHSIVPHLTISMNLRKHSPESAETSLPIYPESA
jgi:hypothetical protein